MGTDKRIYHHHLSSVKPPPVDIDLRAVVVSSILNIRRLPVSNCSNESASYRQGRDSVPMFLHRGGMGRVKVGMSPGKMRGALTLKLGTVHMNRSVVGRRKLESLNFDTDNIHLIFSLLKTSASSFTVHTCDTIVSGNNLLKCPFP